MQPQPQLKKRRFGYTVSNTIYGLSWNLWTKIWKFMGYPENAFNQNKNCCLRIKKFEGNKIRGEISRNKENSRSLFMTRQGKYPPCCIFQKTSHLEKNCRHLNVNITRNLDTWRKFVATKINKKFFLNKKINSKIFFMHDTPTIKREMILE